MVQSLSVLIISDKFERAHAPQHILLPCFGPGEIDHWVVFRRGFGQARQHRKFAQTEFTHGLTKVSARSRFKAIGTLAQIDLIDVELENLVLGKIVLDFDGQHGFGQFARQSFFIRQKKITRHLHGDCGSAFLGAA